MAKLILLLCISALIPALTAAQMNNDKLQPFAPDGVPFVVADSSFMPDMKGNHRAVVRVDDPKVEAVVATIPWRRPDLRPETKKIVVYGASGGKEVVNVTVLDFSSEKGIIAFQPLPGENEYYVYYLPYKFRRGWDDARYGKPWNDYLAPDYSAAPQWVGRVKQSRFSVPEAKVLRIESRSEFDAFTPMGLIATRDETDSILKNHPGNFLVYTEDRSFPVRLPNTIPARWAKNGPSLSFSGTAARNEYYTWQIGIWAARKDISNIRLSFSDFVAPGSVISHDSVTCFNQEGINWDGQPVTFRVDVPVGKVQALWCGIQIPHGAKPGEYKGYATLAADNEAPVKITVRIRVTDRFLADRGDSELWRYSRLRWLNSTIGLDDIPVDPYQAMELRGNSITATEKTVELGKNGLPGQITLNSRRVFSVPAVFEVATASGLTVFNAGNLVLKQTAPGRISWTSSSVQDGMKFSCTAYMDFDGFISYAISLSAAGKPVTVKDARLRMNFSPESSEYFIGAGMGGGLRPEDHTWWWDGPYDSFWTGGDKSGLHVEFTGNVYHGPLIADYKPGPPANWANNGKGSISLKGPQGKAPEITVSTGEFTLTSDPVEYKWNMLVTPVHPVNPARHFSERYYHSYPKDFSKAAEEGGANIANIHHAQLLNPFINYPFIVRDSLRMFIEEQHQAGRKVKLYYTVRELTTHCAEVYPLMSLKNQIFEPGPGYGLPWECEHLIDSYKPAWYTELPNQVSDAALVLVGSSRWINYYLEGLKWMFQNYEIDGIYMDDVSFDRPVMKRMRRIIAQYRPGALIDLHSNTAYSKGPANQYAGFFPYVDRLWFGESFQYNNMSPDQWFVTASGIPFGQMAEMLQGGGNRYLGMVFGETARDAYGESSPRPVWKLWKEFGITEARMKGYWDSECPVKTNNGLVKASAYLKPGKTLVSIGNFADADTTVELTFDWKSLGMESQKAVIYAPEVLNFQEAKTFTINEPLRIKSKQGLLLVIEQK